MRDAEWTALELPVPSPRPGGRPRGHPVREMLNAIGSVLRSGCAWRRLPQELPPWKTVSHDCRLWRLQGLWETRPTTLREVARAQAGRDRHPRAARMDRQSVKTTGVRGGPGR